MAHGDVASHMPLQTVSGTHPDQTSTTLKEKDSIRNLEVTEPHVADSSNDENQYPGFVRRTAIVSAVALSLFLTIVATAIPKITDDFSGIDYTGWYSSAFFITLGPFQPFWGKIYQYFSLKYSFILANVVFELGSLIAGVAPSSAVLIIGRAITGIGGAGIATGGYAIMPVVLRPGLRPVFTGLVTTMYSIGSVVGPLVGGALAENTTWRWCFYLNLPLGAIAAFGILFFFQDRPTALPKQQAPLKEKLSHLDFVGSLLTLGVLVCFARALQVAGTTKAWNSAEVIGLLAGSFALFLTFLLSQRLLGERAMMVKHLLRKREVIVGMVYGFFFEGAAYTLLFALPLYFQAVSGVSPGNAGVRNMAFLLSCGLGSFAAGAVVQRVKYVIPMLLWATGGLCVGIGLLYTMDAHSSSAHWIGYQVLAGFAAGTGLPLAIIVGQASAPTEDVASITAMLLYSFQFGTSLALAMAQSLLDNLLLNSLPATAPGVDPHQVLQVGVTEIRSSFPASIVPGIVDAYIYGLRAAYSMMIGFAGAAALAALCYPWKKLEFKK